MKKKDLFKLIKIRDGPKEAANDKIPLKLN